MFKPYEKVKMLEISTDFKRKGKSNSMGGIIIHYIKNTSIRIWNQRKTLMMNFVFFQIQFFY